MTTPSPLLNIAVVIPARNEAATIHAIASGAARLCRAVLVVDDGSTDGTADALAGLPVTVLRHAHSRGKGAALVTGFAAALATGVDAVATLDADGQHRPEDLPRFAEFASLHPHSIVMGSRMSGRAAFPVWRYRGNRIAAFWLSWACGQRIEDSQSGFRLFPRDLLERVTAPSGRGSGFVYESEFLVNASQAGYRIVSLPIPAIYAHGARASYYRPWRDTWAITRMIARKLIGRGLFVPGLIASLRDGRSAKRPTPPARSTAF